jgi:hypothetical protein
MQKTPVLIEVAGTMALVLVSRMLPPRLHVPFAIVAAVFGAACDPSVEPITVARECPSKPYRRPAAAAANADKDLLIADFENAGITLAGHWDGVWILGSELNPTPNKLVAEPSPDCAADGRAAGHVALSPPHDWGANWIGEFHARTSAGTAVPYDARAYGGVSFWAAFGEGNEDSESVAFGVATWDTAWDNSLCQLCASGSTTAYQCVYCSDHYLYNVPLTREWTRYTVRFEQMVQTPAYIPMRRDQLVGFVIWPRKQVDLWVDDIRFEL